MDRPLTQAIVPGNGPLNLSAYRQSGGYEASRSSIGVAKPADIVSVILDSGLTGCGGGGFSTGRKWQAMPPRAARPGRRYLVVNADEMEPGTFKDRFLIENNPHQLIEGMILAACALEVDTAYIFIRGEYQAAIAVLEHAIAEAHAACLLGDLHIHIHAGAGRYICGEETALLNSLEGKRAIPRSKPPLPQVSGLWGCPTVVNNVETICNIAPIIRNGAGWYRTLGEGGEAGTRLFGVSGRVNRPGLYELPVGTSLRVLIESCAGGMQDGFEMRAVLPGGASTGFLAPAALDTPMSMSAMVAAGTRLGTGNAVVLDDATCPIGFIRNLQHFFAQESCGWCAPCRDGLPWVERLLDRMEAGEAGQTDLAVLAGIPAQLAAGRTFCGLAPGAMASLETGLKLFQAEFLHHAQGKSCAWQ
jgi:NADH-quinone oxidoreductase subunit F